ncbi:cytochrome P450 4C1-like [Chrysoperla carnea]|uniref:cytochrome P450 4C1-like n=1 Tax=Chrysoperla carnea TaxID=189513 RepID=UPI001D06E436|nr:cytochrome P450 4C1-like [Chrysoperla carnea]
MQLSRVLPGPPSLPLIGNAHLFRGNTEANKFPSPFKLWLSYRFFTVIYNPNDIETVLNKALEKDPIYALTRPWTGTGLFAAPVPKWKAHRKVIQPTFNTKVLDSFMDVFAIQSEILVKILEKQLDKGYFDVFNFMSPCTLDIICETAMGYKISAQQGGNTKYVHCALRQLKIEFLRMSKVWLQPNIIFKFTKLAREQEENVKYLHSITNTVIQRKIEDYKQRKQNELNNNKIEVPDYSDNDTSSGYSKRKAFLDYLIELAEDGHKFSETSLREEVDTMMIAGNDTTASVNSFVLMMLGIHQDIQEKVYEEIYNIFGDSDRPCTNEDVKQMPYLEMVIKETLRLFPPGVVIMRYVTRSLQLEKYTIPKGAGTIITIMHTHRLPDIWPDPLKFDPNRFLPEECAKRHPYSFLPFSGGPRNCIETNLGEKMDFQKKDYSKYIDYSCKILTALVQWMGKVWLHPNFIFKFSSIRKKIDFYREYILSTSKRIIRERTIEIQEQRNYEKGNQAQKPFLENLILAKENGASISDYNIQCEVNTLIVAGSDTTANVMCYVFMCLGVLQDIQDKVYEELYSVFGDSDRECTLDDIKLLYYLEMVIKETMRLFTPVPMLARNITQNIKIQSVTLPPGTNCVIGVLQMHRSPEIYPDPLEFDPSRFTPEEIAKRHPASFIPFGAGPRNCVGQKFAYMSMKIILSTVLRKYRVYSDVDLKNIDLQMEIFLKPVNGYRVRLEPRNQS